MRHAPVPASAPAAAQAPDIPTTPTPGEDPDSGASPWVAAASTSCPNRTPASTRAVLLCALMSTFVIRLVVIISVSGPAGSDGP